MKNKRKLILPLMLLLVVLSVGTTIAWLTSTDQIINEFTVGEITNPGTDPEDPTQTITLTGNLYEKEWDPTATHKIVPGAEFNKKPYVGVGDGSEEAVVYVYIDNDFASATQNKVYFLLNSGWTPVTGHTSAGPETNSYTKGLFKYNTNLTGASGDDWTSTPIFNKIIVANNASTADLTPASTTYNVTVKSFIHQAKDASGNAINASDIENAAIAALE